MKSFIIGLLIVVSFASSVHPQNRTDKVMTYALVGPIRTVRTETANVLMKKDGHYVEGPRKLNMTISLNEDGNRTELGLYDEKGSLVRRIVSRFDGRKLVEFLNYDGAGKMWLRGVDVYDAEGRLREKATYNGDGSLRSKTTLTRNDRGQVVEQAKSDAEGTLLQKSSNTFNEAGELKSVERSSYRADGSLSRRELHNLTEKRSETLSYNKDGSFAGKSIWVNQEITEYAPDGSLKKSTFITSMGRLPEELTYNPDGNTRKESQIPDEIDAHGNWVKQTKWVSESQGISPVKVTYRTITYY
jgi:antitoxin component YwqK of YwqJK toxin-antitoxin module